MKNEEISHKDRHKSMAKRSDVGELVCKRITTII